MGMELGFIGYNDLAGVEADAKFSAEHGFTALEYNTILILLVCTVAQASSLDSLPA